MGALVGKKFTTYGDRRIGSLMGLALAGCSPLTIVNSLVPARTYRREQDIAYGDNARQRLDFYQPTTAQRNAPLVVFFYGGNWESGRREDYLFVGEALASRGFVTAIPDYRLYPEVRYPVFLNDSAMAVRVALDRAREFGADPHRLVLMGHSAGAYNAAMLALEPKYLRSAGVDPAAVRTWVGLAGPYDFLPLKDDSTRDIFGYPDTAPSTQPIAHVRDGAPPALLVTAATDDVVDPGNSRRLATRLREHHAPVREVTYPSPLGHRTLVGALAAPLRILAPVLGDVTAFIRERTS